MVPPSGSAHHARAHWTIYLPSLGVAATWTVVYFWATWQDPPLLAIRAIALAVEAVVVPLLLVHAYLRARVLRVVVEGGMLIARSGFPYTRHLQIDLSDIALAQVRRSFAQRFLGGGALALIRRNGQRHLVPDLAEADEVAKAINDNLSRR